VTRHARNIARAVILHERLFISTQADAAYAWDLVMPAVADVPTHGLPADVVTAVVRDAVLKVITQFGGDDLARDLAAG
jgi:hypothetical protein